MKRGLIYIFIFFYMTSFLKPFTPAIYGYVSKTIWTHQHTNLVESIKGNRINVLAILGDMAKHNNPKQDNTPPIDSVKLSSGSIICIIPSLNNLLIDQPLLQKYFDHYNLSEQLVFRQLSTPPPKVA